MADLRSWLGLDWFLLVILLNWVHSKTKTSPAEFKDGHIQPNSGGSRAHHPACLPLFSAPPPLNWSNLGSLGKQYSPLLALILLLRSCFRHSLPLFFSLLFFFSLSLSLQVQPWAHLRATILEVDNRTHLCTWSFSNSRKLFKVCKGEYGISAHARSLSSHLFI